MNTATTRLATPMSTNSTRALMPSVCSSAEENRADRHEGGVEHVDGGDHAGAMIGTGPRLHGGERRHDEQAAGDRQPGEIDGDIGSSAARRNNAHDVDCAGCTPVPTKSAEVDREQAEQHAADQRRQQHDTSCRKPGGQADPIATDTEKMARKA